MIRKTSVLLIALASGVALSSCANDAEPKPVGPVSETSKIPWNAPVAGQGQGQLGMLPQNQYRR
jgi:phosphate/sulfate permease